MIELLKSTEVVEKVGGRFKLTALVQKRLGELLQGARPLIEDTKGKTQLEILIEEIMQDIREFPAHLSLDDQGLFAIGYYHQRKDFYTKSDKKEDNNE